jgi:hypothetical protein
LEPRRADIPEDDWFHLDERILALSAPEPMPDARWLHGNRTKEMPKFTTTGYVFSKAVEVSGYTA